jgi:hypothetical protein
MRAADFLDTLGVNTHFTQGYQYGDVAGTLKALQFIGVHYVRDSFDGMDPSTLGALAKAGIKVNHVTGGTDDIAGEISKLHATALSNPGELASIEGPNETNNWPVTYKGQTNQASGPAFYNDFLAALKQDPVLSNVPTYNLTSWPYLVTNAQFGNIHPYANDGDQPLATLLAAMKDEQAGMGSKRQAITETGYHTLPGQQGREGVDEPTQAKLLLNTLMDATSKGIARTYIYQLLDQYTENLDTNTEAHYGLFDLKFNPKPSATAVHNLTSILADSGSNASTFQPGSLGYTVSGLPSSGNQVVLEQADGTYDLVLWAEPDIWDQSAHKPISAAGANVTVNLGSSKSVTVYDPLTGTGPTSTTTGSTVTVQVSDHPVVVKIGS